MFEPRVALASLSGEADAAWARAGSDHAGAAFLGGVALDEATREAARKLVARDREEFLPDDPLVFVEDQLDALSEVPIRPGVNVRSATLEPIADAARICAEHDAILEINAHCRQTEMCEVGCGESLLRDTGRLCDYVDVASDAGAAVSVKVRTEVSGVDLVEIAQEIDAAGANAVHVDAMDTESVVADVVDAAPDLFVVANNEVRDRESVREYLHYGADAVSIGRPSTDARVRRRVRRAVEGWFAETDRGEQTDAAQSSGTTPGSHEEVDAQ